jgi:hypothetical protein
MLGFGLLESLVGCMAWTVHERVAGRGGVSNSLTELVRRSKRLLRARVTQPKGCEDVLENPANLFLKGY